jgi:hypothetical protein
MDMLNRELGMNGLRHNAANGGGSGGRSLLTAFLAIALIAIGSLAARAEEPATSDDAHAGYYYPQPQSSETYEARVQTLQESDRGRRIGFVTGLTKQLLTQRFDPGYAIFAKGDDADKLIIVALESGRFDTMYRARALLANLTAVARLTPFFQQYTLADQATFLDLLKLLGFKQVTVSDGASFAHQITIK